MEMVANTIMRDPAWNVGDGLHPADTPKNAEELGIGDGDFALIETRSGSARIEAEVTDSIVSRSSGIRMARACPRRRGTWSQCEPTSTGKTPRSLRRHAAASLYSMPGAKGLVWERFMSNSLSFDDQKDLLIKGWMSHDARWFMAVANILVWMQPSTEPIRMQRIGRVEMKRYMKTLGLSR